MSQLALATSRFFLKRKSQIFSALTLAVPAAILSQGHPEFMLPLVISAMGSVLSILLLPRYVRLLLKTEDKLNLNFAKLSPARTVRMAFHGMWVAGILNLLTWAWKTSMPDLATQGGLLLASSGIHGLAVILAYRGHGDRNSNVLLAFTLSAWLAALALATPLALYLILAFSTVLVWHMISGALSDLRSSFYPKRGIGVFFGTFNPVHSTHLKIMKEALETRQLSKVFVHPTTVPKLHRTALASGEISITYKDGMRVYHKTELADPSKNYFPTGNRFYEYEVRNELLRASIQDAGLQGRVEVLDLPDIYDKDGFFGIIRHLQDVHRGIPVHGLHGSDVGGIWVRHIFDLCGWVYPFPVRRVDNISATAIRNGAVGCTSETVEAFLQVARNGHEFRFPSGYLFSPTGKSNLKNRTAK